MNKSEQRGERADKGGNGMDGSKRKQGVRGKGQGRKRTEGSRNTKEGLEKKASQRETNAEIM